MQEPSIGRIVHYYDVGSVTPIAAIIVRVWDGDDEMVNLRLFTDDDDLGARIVTSVPYTDIAGDWGWQWPPRV